METLLQQVLSGLAAGGIYGCLALAIVMIFQATHLVNFAQGELAMFSTYLAWALLRAGAPYWLAFVATVVLSFVLGVVIQRWIVRRVEDKPALAAVIVFIGLMLVLNGLAAWIFGTTIKTFPSPFPDGMLGSRALMNGHEVGVLATTAIVVVVLYVFLRHTSLGLALRAAAIHPESSRLVGIRVSHMLAVGWGAAAAIGAVAGMLVAPIVFLDPGMMSGVMLYAFAAALLGGIDSPGGAIVGGLIVGVLENVMGAYVVGTELKLTVALLLIVGVLVVKPAGLFGRVVVTRV